MIHTSVVVPAYNAAATLSDCLRSLCSQDAQNDRSELIVVDDASRDATAAIARSFGVRTIHRKHAGAGAARNAGLAAARGEWIAFTDADCIPARSWLRALNAAVALARTQEQPIGAAGKTVGFESHTDAARFCNLAGSLDAQHYLSHPKFPFAPSSNLMYRRSVLEEVGGFDERYVSYEACDLHCRILKNHPGPFVYEPRALVFHRHRSDWKAYFRQQYSYGIGYAQFTLHHRDECRWAIGNELREWAAIGQLGVRAWLPASNEALLYARGMFVKKLAQRLGFINTRLNHDERRRW